MNTTPRTKRLIYDYEKVKEFSILNNALLEIESVMGNPPVIYHLIIHCRGLALIQNDMAIYSDTHKLSIRLEVNYPATKPIEEIKSPIFHPNIYPNGLIDIYHNWLPAMHLAHVIARAIRIIRYEEYNFFSVANSAAANWARLNLDKLPLDTQAIIESSYIGDEDDKPIKGTVETETRYSRPISIFLCHASQDKPKVRNLYQQLINNNGIDPWLDEEKLLPGHNWRRLWCINRKVGAIHPSENQDYATG